MPVPCTVVKANKQGRGEAYQVLCCGDPTRAQCVSCYCVLLPACLSFPSVVAFSSCFSILQPFSAFSFCSPGAVCGVWCLCRHTAAACGCVTSAVGRIVELLCGSCSSVRLFHSSFRRNPGECRKWMNNQNSRAGVSPGSASGLAAVL